MQDEKSSESEDLTANSNLFSNITMVNLAILMFGLGCAISLPSLIVYFKHPKQFVTGLVLQLFIMPFLGLGLSQAVRMPTVEALGVCIQATCPGGTYSNVISYWLDGDMNLSVVMTTASTILAMGTMPLWLYLFPIIIKATDTIQIPYDQLGYALLGSVGPIFVGMIIKWKFPQHAEKITRYVTLFASIAIIVTSVAIGLAQNRTIVVTWRQVVVAILFPTISLVLGYLATRLPCLSFTVSARRTVAIETAMQNAAIGTTIVILSFDPSSEDFIVAFMFPVLYGGVQLFTGVVACSSYIIYKRKGYTALVPPEVLEQQRERAAEAEAGRAGHGKVGPAPTADSKRNMANGIENPSFNSDGAGASSDENYNESET